MRERLSIHANPVPLVAAGLAFAATLLLALSSAAHADDKQRPQQPLLPAYQQECGSCHLAYPASLLPASSWNRIMANLAGHYGADASLDATATQQISAWLQAHAGSTRRLGQAAPADDRITRSPRFERAHRRIDAAVWRAPGVKSPANCAACHVDAASGDFDDDRLRIPPGLTRLQQRALRGD